MSAVGSDPDSGRRPAGGLLARARTLHRRHPRRVAAAWFTMFVLGVVWVKPMGLLLWTRLRIISNMPRTAIADPEPRAIDPARKSPADVATRRPDAPVDEADAGLDAGAVDQIRERGSGAPFDPERPIGPID